MLQRHIAEFIQDEHDARLLEGQPVRQSERVNANAPPEFTDHPPVFKRFGPARLGLGLQASPHDCADFGDDRRKRTTSRIPQGNRTEPTREFASSTVNVQVSSLEQAPECLGSRSRASTGRPESFQETHNCVAHDFHSDLPYDRTVIAPMKAMCDDDSSEEAMPGTPTTRTPS